MTDDPFARRDFLRLATVAAAGTTIGARGLGVRQGPDAPAPGAVRLGVASYSLRQFPLAKAVEMTRALGTPWINLKSVHLPYDASAAAVEDARRAIAAAGLEVVGGGTITFDEDSEVGVRRYFEYARRAGMPLIVATCDPRVLPRVERFAKEYDVRVAIHNHGPEDPHFPSPYDVLRAVRTMDPRVGLCLDVGHAARAGADVVRAVADAGPRLLDMHAKDLRDLADKESQCVVGEGRIPWPDLFRQLQSTRYAGYVNLEYEIDPDDPLPGMRRSFAYMRGVLAGLALAHTRTGRVPEDAAPRVELVDRRPERRVDVLVDGRPFTSYRFPADLPKPVLYPLRTASGTEVTRGWPLAPRPGERVDHPHHIGLWFNHADVNGLDFWNNSSAIPASHAGRMGTIAFRGIDALRGGAGAGVLEVRSDWLKPDGTPLLRETTRCVFRAADGLRGVDRVTTLTALGTDVTFRDNKDGTLGLRVRRELEQPWDTPEVFTDGSGRATAVPVLDNAGVTGRYHSAEGRDGDAVWGTRARWTTLGGTVDGEPVTIAIIDHPKNYNFPTYWHARGYGLFAANPLGAKDFTGGKVVDDFTIAAGRTVTFRHRVVILNGATTPARVEEEFRDFAR